MIGKHFALVFLIQLCSFLQLSGQNYPDLIELNGSGIKTYYSPGNEERAKIIAGRCENAMKYIQGLTNFKPKVSLFILNPEHWTTYATFPVYGMPHYPDDQRLVIAAQDNDFWKSFIPPLHQLPKDLAQKVIEAYASDDGTLTMMGFFDLLAIHELGHAFHEQAGLDMQRLWMQELFCNIMLHTYVAENEPSNLPALEVFPEMVVAAGPDGYAYTSLADFEKLYDRMDPKNYGWYQCRLHVAGKNIYNEGGKNAFVRLWKALLNTNGKLNDEQLAIYLEKNVGKTTSSVMTAW
jgi:hypothetical protein